MSPISPPVDASLFFQAYRPPLEGDETAVGNPTADCAEHNDNLMADCHQLQILVGLFFRASPNANLARQHSAIIEQFMANNYDQLDSSYGSTLMFAWLGRFVTALSIAKDRAMQLSGLAAETFNEAICRILDDCLEDFDKCSAATSSRLQTSYDALQALLSSSLNDKLFIARTRLFHQGIEQFMVEQARNGRLATLMGNRSHVHNALHNLACQQFGIPAIEDPLAPGHLSERLIQQFYSYIQLVVSKGNITFYLASEFYQQIRRFIEESGNRHWLDQDIPAEQLLYEHTERLRQQILEPMQMLFASPAQISLPMIFALKQDGTYTLDGCLERILHWLSSQLSNGDAQTLAIIPKDDNRQLVIHNLDDFFFFAEQRIAPNMPGEQLPMRLSYLAELDLASWPDLTIYNLVCLSARLTHQADEIIQFACDQKVVEQLKKCAPQIRASLIDILMDKYHQHSQFRATLGRSVTNYLLPALPDSTSSSRRRIETLDLMLESVLMPVFTALVDNAFWSDPDEYAKIRSFNDCLHNRQSAIEGVKKQIHYGNLSTQVGNIMRGSYDTLLNTVVNHHSFVLYAVASNHIDLLQYLCQRPNVELDVRAHNGLTPLMLAARDGKLRCIKILLSRAAGLLGHTDNDGNNALLHAVKRSHLVCIDALLPSIPMTHAQLFDWHKNNIRALKTACKPGKEKCLSLLLNFLALHDYPALARIGSSLLMSAAERGDLQHIRLLTSCKAIDINRADNSGHTPLTLAAFYRHDKALAELLRSPALDINRLNQYGMSALQIAAQWLSRGNYQCFEILVSSRQAHNFLMRKATGELLLEDIIKQISISGESRYLKLLTQASGMNQQSMTDSGETLRLLIARLDHQHCVGSDKLQSVHPPPCIQPIPTTSVLGHKSFANCGRLPTMENLPWIDRVLYYPNEPRPVFVFAHKGHYATTPYQQLCQDFAKKFRIDETLIRIHSTEHLVKRQKEWDDPFNIDEMELTEQ